MLVGMGEGDVDDGEDDEQEEDDGAAISMEELDRRICGDLVEKNRRLDELFLSQSLDN